MSTQQPTNPDEQLPPLEPPSATFIVQLFVIPGVIVVAIVSVWLLFSWIVHRGTARPEDVVAGLEGSGPARWQRASELADMLRSERYAEFRQSSAAAQHLADLLAREIEAAGAAGGMDSGSLNLRYFLCRALGEFEVSDGLDVLITAATTQRDKREQWVRRGAIQGLAMLAYKQLHEAGKTELDPTRLEATLIRLADDQDELIRSETAFALGRLGTPAALAELETMVDDPHVDTRYNAAVGLAAHGNLAALDTLAEMLDLEESASVRQEELARSQATKRALIIKNASQAVVHLAQQNAAADFSAVREALQRIVDADAAQLQQARIDQFVVAEARRTLEFLAASRPAGASARAK